MVVVSHWHMTHNGFHSPLTPYGNTGVRIFFVISGYLITSLLLKEQTTTSTISLGGFYRRRAFRILPAATVFVIAIAIIRWKEVRWYDLGAALFYLANFNFFMPSFLAHFWSLAVEEQFYLLWPTVLKKWGQHKTAVLLGVIVFAPFYMTFCDLLRINASVSFTFPAVADNLAVGSLLAIFAPRIRKIPASLAVLMALVVVLVPQFHATSKTHTLLLLFCFSPLMQICIAGVLLHVVQRPYWLLNIAPVVWLGKISYSLYLWQQIFFFNPHSKLAEAVIGSLGLACASYYLIEQPMLRLRDRRKAAVRPISQAPRAYAAAGD
jgi:peptidoglycan/LPS O-acetylase OafA/YrhL